MNVAWHLAFTLTIFTIILDSLHVVSAQESSYELPVQLVGFPFIIAAVKITNFVKKLGYSLSPATYRARTRRQIASADASAAEKSIIQEFGEDVCVYGRVCAHYADEARQGGEIPENIDWNVVLKQYKRSPDKNKQYYLLSVFLGDIVASPQLCFQLAKRRPCSPDTLDWDR